MHKEKKRILQLYMLLLVMCTFFSGCSLLFPAEAEPGGSAAASQTGGQSSIRVDTGFVVYGTDAYDSADSPILVSKDTENQTLTFLNMDLGERYTLSYDGTTRFSDKYGTSLSLEQLRVGELVDVKFVKSKKHLTSMQGSAEGWVFPSTREYLMNPVKKEVTIGEDVYKLNPQIAYFSEGREVEARDLISTDTLTFYGMGTNILSIVVENGHGYLRLTGQENFVDGWIEIGTTMITKVTDDMLLTLPEGRYAVKISHKGSTAESEVAILRNEETLLDFTQVEVESPKVGQVVFSLNPADAELYVDGEKTDTSQPKELTYGIHQLICRASGYQSVTRYLSVGQAQAGVNIILDPEKTGEQTADGDKDSQKEGETDASSNGMDVTGSYYKVFIDAPSGAEVHVDGAYVGVAPCSFKKIEGAHVITLSKPGYETRSYTIEADGEDRDISFSFVDLLPVTGLNSGDTVSSLSEIVNSVFETDNNNLLGELGGGIAIP